MSMERIREIIANHDITTPVEDLRATPHGNLLVILAHRIADTEARLTNAAKKAARRAANIPDSITHGRSVNSLGELQNDGLRVDVLCGVLEAHREDLTYAVEEYKKN